MEGRIRFVSPLERAIHLRSMEGLQNLSVSEVASLAQKANERSFRKGEKIFRASEPVDALHVIVEGSLETEVEGLPPKAFRPPNVIGVLHMLSNATDGIEATALEDCITLEIDRDSLMQIYEDNFSVLHNAVQGIANQTLLLRKRIPDGTFLGSAERVGDEIPERFGLVERLLIMLKGVVFHRVNMDAVVELARHSREVRFEPGTRLWSRGERSGHILSIIAGTVRCEVEPGTRSFRAGPGYPLGNVESIAGAPRWYEGVVESPLLALRADTGVFLDVLEDNFDVATDYLAALANNLLTVFREQHAGAGEMLVES